MVNFNYIFFAEFFGTFLLALTITFISAFDTGSVMFTQFVILAGFFIAITLTRAISGGHINPGVTLAVYLSESQESERQNKLRSMWVYILAQILGALTAGLLGAWMLHYFVVNLQPNIASAVHEPIILEAVGSALFYSLIMIQGDSHAKLYSDTTASTLTVTAGLAAGIAMTANISGACLNPAIGIGFNLVRFIVTGDIHEIASLWVYIIGPLLGSVLTGLFYRGVFKSYDFSGNDDIRARLLDNKDTRRV